MFKELEQEIEVYEYYLKNGEMRYNKAYFWAKSDDAYHIRTLGERRTRGTIVKEIEPGIYKSPSRDDHLYMIDNNPKRALELFIQYSKQMATRYKCMLDNALTRIKYLEFQLEEVNKAK